MTGRTDPHRWAPALLAAAVLWPGAAAAQPVAFQEQRPPESSLSEPVRTLFARLPADLEDWDPEGMAGAIAMQTFPLAGREDLVARLDPGAYRYRDCPRLPGDPLEMLAQKARRAQIVIVNEAHDQPLHREVVRALGIDLADDFDVFAAETLAHEALVERESGRITDSLGSYSDEPIFGRELRSLERAGYRFVAYEIRQHQQAPQGASTAERVIAREQAQAENLIAEVLDEDPGARILVHVGYSHALEAPVNNFDQEIEWFAARLKRKTGIDPLTVSQTHCSLAAGEAANAYDGLALADGSGAVESPGAIDVFLAHPPIRFDSGRPAWRRAIGDSAVPVPDAFRSNSARTIVEARAPDDPGDEVPVDRLLLYPGESLPLLLPPGTWRLTGWREDGEIAPPVDLTVER